jgi:hypothetical protein
MPEKWDSAEYRKRATAWREKAASLPETDPNRMACLALADGYERLATQLEKGSVPEDRRVTQSSSSGRA